MHTPSAESKGGQQPVTFTLDGVEYTVQDRRQTAGAILQLAGLDAADYDLLRVVGKETENPYADDQVVTLVPHGRYVSMFTGSTPVA